MFNINMKKKLRKIIINSMIFWWKADWFYHFDDRRIIRVRIWGSDKKGQPLYVNLTYKWVEYLVYSSYLKPKDIAAIIEYALSHGWHPFIRRTAPYWLKQDVDHLILDNFVLTNIC